MENVAGQNHDDPTPPTLGETKPQHALENGVFGKWTVRLRNLGGIIATLVVCLNSVLYVWTTHISVTAGHGWPDRTSLLIMTVGPIIASFTFMDSSKILRILSQTGGVGEQLRKRTVKALQRAGDEPPPPRQDTPQQ